MFTRPARKATRSTGPEDSIWEESASSWLMETLEPRVLLSAAPVAAHDFLLLHQAAPAAAPANDNFANPVVQSGTTATWTGSNVGATRQTGEPNPAGVTGGASVWLTWTAPTTRTVSLNTHGSTFDTVLAVYTGSALTSLTAVAANDDDVANGTLTSAVTFTAVAGTVYHILADGYHGATGTILLNLA